MIGIDTNILVNAFDGHDDRKKKISTNILKEVFSGNKKLAITNQVLAEFAVVSTTKLRVPLSEEEVISVVLSICGSENWGVFDYGHQDVISAVNSHNPFWDALIASTLKRNGIDTIFTENIGDFRDSGLKVVNPYE